ncbi:MAG: hypothetical protein PHI68_03315 [Candidatus Cloacimonetes bacterium]|nr:hypothetical protein [Candidatus Cloacimonadota bacterium]
MKKYGLLVLLLLPLFLFCQMAEEDSEPTEGTNFGMSGAVGSITIGDQTYSQIRLMPEISVWKFGFGLDIDLLIDSEGNIREEDWDEAEDIINKIYYIRFAQRRDPFYFKVGSIPDYTLGHGLIFDGYSNTLRYPAVRNIGGYVGINTPFSGLGMEVFTHNIEKNEILAGRLHARPLELMDFPLLSKIRLGVNFGIDRDQYGKYEDKDGDGYPDAYDAFPDNELIWIDTDGDGFPDPPLESGTPEPGVIYDIDVNGNGGIDHPDENTYVNQEFPGIATSSPDFPFNTGLHSDTADKLDKEKEVLVYSVDYELPLIETDMLALSHYAEYAMIQDYGNGIIFPGFAAKFFIFESQLEFRNFSDKFLPGYFNNLYDEQRSNVLYTTDPVTGARHYTLVTKDSQLDAIKASLGWFGSLRANIANIIFLKVAYQDMYGEDVITGKSIWGTLGLDPALVPRLKEAQVTYGQTDVPYISIKALRSPSAQINGRLAYGLSDSTYLVGNYSERYFDLDGNGEIKGKDEVVKSMTFGVEFQF